MIVKNTKGNLTVKNVTDTLAIEDMYLSQEFVSELIDVANGKKTSEELRTEVIQKYIR